MSYKVADEKGSGGEAPKGNSMPSKVADESGRGGAAPKGQHTSFFRKLFTIVPWSENLGILKDHRPEYRRHWIESGRHNPQELKSSVCFVLEMEVLLGALFLGFVISLFAFGVTAQTKAAFANGDVGTIDFWIALTGCLAVLFPLIFTPCCYVVLVVIMPISNKNIYAFLRSPTMEDALTTLAQTLLASFYLIFSFVILVFIRDLGGGLSAFLVVGSIFPLFFKLLFCINLCINQGMYSGAWSPHVDVTKSVELELSNAECEEKMYVNTWICGYAGVMFVCLEL